MESRANILSHFDSDEGQKTHNNQINKGLGIAEPTILRALCVFGVTRKKAEG